MVIGTLGFIFSSRLLVNNAKTLEVLGRGLSTRGETGQTRMEASRGKLGILLFAHPCTRYLPSVLIVDRHAWGPGGSVFQPGFIRLLWKGDWWGGRMTLCNQR